MDERTSSDNDVPDLSSLLARVDDGDMDAFAKLIEAVYPELKRLARYHLASERPGHTLNATAIVHEAYLRMAGKNFSWEHKGHFMRASSKVMRHLLVDHARKRNALKRGGGEKILTLKEYLLADGNDSMAVIALDNAIKDMLKIDPSLEELVECRLFASLNVPETAQALGMSKRTVERKWQYARAFLISAMKNEAE